MNDIFKKKLILPLINMKNYHWNHLFLLAVTTNLFKQQ